MDTGDFVRTLMKNQFRFEQWWSVLLQHSDCKQSWKFSNLQIYNKYILRSNRRSTALQIAGRLSLNTKNITWFYTFLKKMRAFRLLFLWNEVAGNITFSNERIILNRAAMEGTHIVAGVAANRFGCTKNKVIMANCWPFLRAQLLNSKNTFRRKP